MEQSGAVRNNWLKTDQAKLWSLNLVIILSGLFSGLMIINVILFLIALSALIILVARFGYGYAVLSGLGSGVICLAIYGDIIALVFVSIVLIPGLVMGYKSRVFSSPFSVISWGMFPLLIPLIFLVVFYPELNSQAPLMIEQMQSMFAENAEQLGLGSSQLQLMYASIQKTVEWTLRLTPGIFFTMFLSIVLFSYLGASAMSPYFGALLPQFKPLYLWKTSEVLLIPLGLSLLFILLGNQGLRLIGENVLVFMIHLYAFFGLCFVDFYFKQFRIPAPIRLIIYLLVLVAMIVIIPVLAVAGVIDSRFDFRKVSQIADKTLN